LLSRAVKAAPTRVTARVDLAIAHSVVRDFDKAKREIEAALEQDPKDLRALNLAGKIDFMKGDFAAAANRLESALRMQTDFDTGDRKSTRLNSSHVSISYAVFCLKKKIPENHGMMPILLAGW